MHKHSRQESSQKKPVMYECCKFFRRAAELCLLVNKSLKPLTSSIHHLADLALTCGHGDRIAMQSPAGKRRRPGAVQVWCRRLLTSAEGSPQALPSSAACARAGPPGLAPPNPLWSPALK